MNKLLQQGQEKISVIESLFDEMRELAQNRSDYSLVKFVVGSHDMPGRQRKQVLDELYTLMTGLQQAVTAYKETEIDIEELKEKTKNWRTGKFDRQRAALKLEGKQRDLKIIDIRVIGLIRECNTLLGLLEQMPKYTREQFEAEEPIYWENRLTRQKHLTDIGSGYNQGNLDAILQLFSYPGMPRLSTPATLPQIMATMGFETKKIDGGENESLNGSTKLDLHSQSSDGSGD